MSPSHPTIAREMLGGALRLLDGVISATSNIAQILQEQPPSENSSEHLSQLRSITIATRDRLRSHVLRQKRDRDSETDFGDKGGRHPNPEPRESGLRGGRRESSFSAYSRHFIQAPSIGYTAEFGDGAGMLPRVNGLNNTFRDNLTINDASGTGEAPAIDDTTSTNIPKKKIRDVNGKMIELSSDDSSEEDIPAIPKALRLTAKSKEYDEYVKKWKKEHGPRPFSLLTSARKEYQKGLRKMMANERMLRTRACKDKERLKTENRSESVGQSGSVVDTGNVEESDDTNDEGATICTSARPPMSQASPQPYSGMPSVSVSIDSPPPPMIHTTPNIHPERLRMISLANLVLSQPNSNNQANRLKMIEQHLGVKRPAPLEVFTSVSKKPKLSLRYIILFSKSEDSDLPVMTYNATHQVPAIVLLEAQVRENSTALGTLLDKKRNGSLDDHLDKLVWEPDTGKEPKVHINDTCIYIAALLHRFPSAQSFLTWKQEDTWKAFENWAAWIRGDAIELSRSTFQRDRAFKVGFWLGAPEKYLNLLRSMDVDAPRYPNDEEMEIIYRKHRSSFANSCYTTGMPVQDR